jgi:MFS family permease
MLSREQSAAVKILLFTSGFTILSLEILGIRILGPYVGTATPIWAALIGIILVGNAVGYYAGGLLADRFQKKEVFFWLAACASVLIMLIPALRSVMNSVVLYFSYGIGALLGAVLLFFVPVICLSALTTYTIRVFVRDLDTVAQVHGDLYALTTIGSVVGVFSTSYVLIPLFAVTHILFGLGAILLLLGAFIARSIPEVSMSRGGGSKI